jgi:hypothetical protein
LEASLRHVQSSKKDEGKIPSYPHPPRPEDGTFKILLEEYKMMRSEVLARENAQNQVLAVGAALLAAHGAIAAQLFINQALGAHFGILLSSAAIVSSVLGLASVRLDFFSTSISGYESQLLVPALEAYGVPRQSMRFYFPHGIGAGFLKAVISVSFPTPFLLSVAGVSVTLTYLAHLRAIRGASFSNGDQLVPLSGIQCALFVGAALIFVFHFFAYGYQIYKHNELLTSRSDPNEIRRRRTEALDLLPDSGADQLPD